MKNIFLSSLLISALIMPLTTTVNAQSEQAISKQQAVNIAQQENPGRVLSVKRKDSNYRVKILNKDGEVRIIVIDANTGRVISD